MIVTQENLKLPTQIDPCITPETANGIAQLEEEPRKLRQMQRALGSTIWHVFHEIKVDRAAYLEAPSWTFDQHHQICLGDEADVFLEQRTFTDLERNALVPVFLHVLEYYEGILILTSNRVGTFDEAFKPRIQLSLQYDALDKPQRRKIWKNSFDRLNDLQMKNIKIEPVETRKRKLEMSQGIDFDDIKCHLGEIAEEKMNGREIRNLITTARQLAKFRNENMSLKQLEEVMKVP
ncbi:hypothetical protein FZEAL_6177 [Fusarium zealandicum]|uniref:AAA+ ATPase lid domain-containing protein n=1 Tax=Fusarium zealandicum TaxID=1053134 RepID=A0A8H4UJ35_9HYPO|nr:hypothetical protein FZEAL_6177 [Fusarium zealandicum]